MSKSLTSGPLTLTPVQTVACCPPLAAEPISSEHADRVDLNGVILIEHTRPAPGITYVGNGRPSGQQPKNPHPSPKS